MFKFGRRCSQDSCFEGMLLLVWAGALTLCRPSSGFPSVGSSTQQYDNLLVNSSLGDEPSQSPPPQVGSGSSSGGSLEVEPPTAETPTSAPDQEELVTLLPTDSLNITNSSIEGNVSWSNCSAVGVEGLGLLVEEVGLGPWTIVGISAAVIALALAIAAVTFALYRHSLWNRPQTLSDKCSNDESTGYIDDSAFRENSEELYSLDNDSFLNSLEAMTIQNYWTDHVKHTKL